MEGKILFIDTETGGIDPEDVSLLSIGLVVWSNGKIVDTKEILIKDKIFKITPEALEINRINLVEFLQKALEPRSAFKEVERFLKKHFKDGNGQVILGGHNTNFDYKFLRKFMIEQSDFKFEFDNIISYRFVDTASIINFLYYAGKIETNVKSLDEALKEFNIETPGNKRHSALADAEATAKLFSELIAKVRE